MKKKEKAKMLKQAIEIFEVAKEMGISRIIGWNSEEYTIEKRYLSHLKNPIHVVSVQFATDANELIKVDVDPSGDFEDNVLEVTRNVQNQYFGTCEYQKLKASIVEGKC